jgi:hypothetical protein
LHKSEASVFDRVNTTFSVISLRWQILVGFLEPTRSWPADYRDKGKKFTPSPAPSQLVAIAEE